MSTIERKNNAAVNQIKNILNEFGDDRKYEILVRIVSSERPKLMIKIFGALAGVMKAMRQDPMKIVAVVLTEPNN